MNCAQFRNVYDSCDLQIKKRFEVVMNQTAHSPTYSEIQKYDSNLIDIIRRRYKTLNNFKKIIGCSINLPGNKEWSREKVVAWVRKFMYDNKRIPTSVEFGHKHVYRYYFGSWQQVLQMSGVIKYGKYNG